MATLTEQISNMVNGVSQQAAALRMSSQAAEQINGYSSIAEGVSKRPPLQHIAKVAGLNDGDIALHTVARDSAEEYTVAVVDGDVRVFDMQGVEQTVTTGAGGFTYFADGTAADLHFVTLKDTTIIVNRAVEVREDTFHTPARERKTMLFVKGVNYDVTFTVKIDGNTVAEHTTSAASAGNQLSTAFLASELLRLYNQTPDNRFTVTRTRNILVFTQTDAGPDAHIEVSDTLNSGYAQIIGAEMRSFTELPTFALSGFETKISGEDPAATPFYLKFMTNNEVAGVAEGYWEEVAAPQTPYALNRFTLPHELVRNEDGSFTFQPLVWGDRIVGDVESVPWPSVVGQQIKDVYLDRNRLCLVHSSGVCMSRARALFEFFPTTVTTVLADGPIDIEPSGSGIANLRNAVAFQQRVVFFGDLRQYSIDVDVLSATEPPALLPTTDYSTDETTVPTAVGSNIYFTLTLGEYTSVMEYSAIGDSTSLDASDVTRHVPRYIPKGAFKLAATSAADVIFLLSKEKRNAIYVYKFYWRGREKLQSSWSRYELPEEAEVLNVDFIRDEAVFFVRYPDGVHILRMAVAEEPSTDTDNPSYLLDRRLNETDCVLSTTDDWKNTVLTLPYDPVTDLVAVSRHGGIKLKGVLLEVLSVVGNVVTVRGDQRGETFSVGERYLFSYTFSPPVLRTQSREGSMSAVSGGNLKVMRWYQRFSRTGFFKAKVNVGRIGGYEYTYSGVTLGSSSAIIGTSSITDGVFKFTVNGNADAVNITLENDTHLPSQFVSAEWEGRYTRRTGR